jgi:beta-mannosidase
MSWYAIARELRPVAIGIARYSLHQRIEGGQDVRFDVWGVNSTLEFVDVDLIIEFYLISTGQRVSRINVHESLMANQVTEIQKSVVDTSGSDADDIVVSVLYALPSGEILRSNANWPEPLKYIDFSDRKLKTSVNGDEISIYSEKPVKGVILDVEGDDDSNLEWSDNGFDVMPGETIKVIAKGLNGRAIKVSWYGDTF